MKDGQKEQSNTPTGNGTGVLEKAPAPYRAPQDAARGGGDRRGRGRGGRQRRPARGGRERFKPEFDQKVIDVRRVARVVSGGRRFNFRVAVVIGNKAGSVGVGLGKGGDTSLAIEKAIRNARKYMIEVKRTDTNSIPHAVEAKYAAARIALMPAPGRGLVVGSSARNVLELAGITDVTSKILSRSKNKLNNARAAFDALSQIGQRKIHLPKKEAGHEGGKPAE